MNIKLLRKVARHILAEPKRLFMGDWICEKGRATVPHKYAKCGTAACIAGWAWKLTYPKRTMPWSGDVAEQLLGISIQDKDKLFYEEEWPKKFKKYKDDGTLKSAQIAVARIEHFIKTKGRE